MLQDKDVDAHLLCMMNFLIEIKIDIVISCHGK